MVSPMWMGNTSAFAQLQWRRRRQSVNCVQVDRWRGVGEYFMCSFIATQNTGFSPAVYGTKGGGLSVVPSSDRHQPSHPTSGAFRMKWRAEGAEFIPVPSRPALGLGQGTGFSCGPGSAPVGVASSLSAVRPEACRYLKASGRFRAFRRMGGSGSALGPSVARQDPIVATG